MSKGHDTSTEAEAESPRLLSGLKGMVAGITSAVVAITALLAALTNLFGNHGSPPARVGAEAPADLFATPTPAAGPSAVESDGTPAHYTGKNSDGQNIEIDWDGKHWVYTDPDTSYVYADLTSSDKDMVSAYDRDIDSYLRWPIAGGAIEESFKSQLEFKPIGTLKTSEGN